MFENYSLGDFFSNLYKNKIVNIILFVILSIALVVPMSINTINRKVVTTDNSSFSTYIVYKIKAPEKEENDLFNKFGYSEFFTKTLQSNLNGAFLFNDLPEEKLEQMASELDTTVVALKNSNFDFWDKKIVINSIPNNIGVTVKILTTSRIVNEEIEKKFDLLVEKYKKVYENISITKEESTMSVELSSKKNVSTGYSKKRLLLKVFIMEAVSLFVVAGLNFIAYIFNPTINRIGDYKKYNIDYIQEVGNIKELEDTIKFKLKKDNLDNITLVSSNLKLLKDIKMENINILTNYEVSSLIDVENVFFVEEFGKTRYSNFEKLLHKVKNMDINILGVVSKKL